MGKKGGGLMDKKAKILVLAELTPESIQSLRNLSVVVRKEADLSDEDSVLSALKEESPDILVVGASPITRLTLKYANRLRLIVCTRGNPVNIDINACTEKGIMVANTPGRNANAVAEFTIGLILCCARFIPQAFRALKERRFTVPMKDNVRVFGQDVIWVHPKLQNLPYKVFRGIELQGRVLGLVGLGTIGERVAAKASALGMEVYGYDPYISSIKFKNLGVNRVDLEKLLRISDFVSLHAKATPKTFHLVGAKELALMKPTAYLINTARGSLVDQKALYEALVERKIAGAALDVFEYEPLWAEDPLLELDNVILTPHIGGASVDVIRHHSDMVLQNVLSFLEGKRPPHLLNPEVLEYR